jgi:hypothetical protein
MIHANCNTNFIKCYELHEFFKKLKEKEIRVIRNPEKSGRVTICVQIQLFHLFFDVKFDCFNRLFVAKFCLF